MAEKVRIQKALSDAGIASRRAAEKMVEQGRIKVNGRPCIIGQQIDPRRDKVMIDGEPVELSVKDKRKWYIALNKPRGYVTTMSDELGRKCVTELVSDIPERIYPVGRLDRNSEGLLIMTNDGDFANLVMHPRSEIEKTYRVTVDSEVTEDQVVDLSAGIVLDGERTLPAVVNVVTKEEGRTVMLMTIKEGKNRQIRRMCEAVGLTVSRLKRIVIGPVRLGMLKPGTWRELTAMELKQLRSKYESSVKNGEGADKKEKSTKNKRYR
ncbi:MAG: rRNA pseudouridine synthase [Oscillospiraceae bacterium]|nr:rRNA pseudouridine synthase [Oscillospiraceae bacterium]MBQ3050185.1 rRNA pseudouridine synthase [Oscillospiraceae bacterium]MBQ9939711.1 rRNA pseudouridine synthase [Oscillospiraceae bacterium]